ncbi:MULTISPECIES: hypothetical protein [Streptomyces]|uniref:Uncharacterized protein n=1 Tax=Streptomyces flavovirens TaxID=52258 RepID=A0ABV8N8T5_9ACTN|nr:hypothetical protein [Streptomyces sp. MBT51]MBK3594842.1 hypothetical protein [Streptomyces sp. MBT51]
MVQCLGPLELVGDRWVIGDPKRKDGLCVVLTPEGVEHRGRADPAPRSVVQWSRFVHLGVHATYWKWEATRTGGFVGAFGSTPYETGRDGCSLQGLLRHSYEPWSVRYTHHRRHYLGSHVFLLKALVRKLTEARALDRLGDPQWLSAAVAALSPVTAWLPSSGNRLVAETIEGLGT